MVFITEGMSLRIPTGGLRISFDGSEPPLVRVEVRLDTWQHWLRIALDQVDQAEQAHYRLLQPEILANNSAKAKALESEFKAAMIGICAAAFSLDAFYTSVRQVAPLSPEIEDAWNRKRTSRASRIAETLRQSFQVRPQAVRGLRQGIEDIFRFRDWAVHPPAEFTEPALHPDLGVGVERRFVTFSSANCRAIGGFTLSLLAQLVRQPKPGLVQLAEWCQFGEGVLKPLVDEWEQTYWALS